MDTEIRVAFAACYANALLGCSLCSFTMLDTYAHCLLYFQNHPNVLANATQTNLVGVGGLWMSCILHARSYVTCNAPLEASIVWRYSRLTLRCIVRCWCDRSVGRSDPRLRPEADFQITRIMCSQADIHNRNVCCSVLLDQSRTAFNAISWRDVHGARWHCPPQRVSCVLRALM